MFASSSSSVLRAAAVPASRIRARQSASFSTSSPRPAKRTIWVELLESLPTLGGKYDRVRVNPGYARNFLVPWRKARLVPAYRGVNPSVRRPLPIELDAGEGRIAAPRPRQRDPITGRLIAAPSTDAAPEDAEPLSEEEEALEAIPDDLIFQLRTISRQSNILHGSVTLADIISRLGEEHGLDGSQITATWIDRDDSARMKEVSRWKVLLTLKSGRREHREVGVVVRKLTGKEPEGGQLGEEDVLEN